ncbi:MAG: hypothetical protein ABJF04_14630 [Reichenbachiella sp.]|uniref:hypothetical protein n=1 Tax=Reichenbachiella sp. TaxID=2184521 RepID=UPI003266AB54
MAGAIDISKYTAAKKNEWDQFIDHSKNGTFHLKRDFVEYHGDKFLDLSLMCYQDKNLVAVLPGTVRNNNYYSHLGLTYGGVVVKRDVYLSHYIDIFSSLILYLKKQGFGCLSVKTIPASYALISNDDFLFCMFRAGASISRTDLLPHIKMAERLSYQSRRKRAIKKALASNLEFAENTNFTNYWMILGELLKDHGTLPVHSLEEITYLHRHFPKNIRLFEVSQNDQLLAGVLIFETDRVARAQYIASTREGKIVGALDYLFDVLIDQVYVDKEWFEFGTTTLNGGKKLNLGLSDQKEGFGARTILQLGLELDLQNYDEQTFKKIVE